MRQYRRSVNLAGTPGTWDDPSPMSTLNALLFFAGLPVLIIAVITLLVMAPSLANGPRYRPSQQWDADAEWFGGPAAQGSPGTLALEGPTGAGTTGDRAAGDKAAGDRAAGDRAAGDEAPGDDSGGASASW